MMYQIIKQQALTTPKMNLLLLLLSLFLPLPPSPHSPIPLLPPESRVKAKKVILKPVDLCAGGRVCDAIKTFYYFNSLSQSWSGSCF